MLRRLRLLYDAHDYLCRHYHAAAIDAAIKMMPPMTGQRDSPLCRHGHAAMPGCNYATPTCCHCRHCVMPALLRTTLPCAIGFRAPLPLFVYFIEPRHFAAITLSRRHAATPAAAAATINREARYEHSASERAAAL